MVSTRGGVALLVQDRDRFSSSAKLLAPHVATRIWGHAYGPFEYPGEDPSVDCTSHPGVRSVSLIDPGLTIFRPGDCGRVVRRRDANTFQIRSTCCAKLSHNYPGHLTRI
ncbi:hypothetical protein F2Q70_00004754 [Brassica cretica]|uniref:Uncharacterized protein n=1 Tax=Brassica cretica TaxID=69181 RepID=A0A8S9J0K7_BRACR|nr:hypothetical protein F2Q70_00004754 [Brassica cretica]